MLGFFVLLIFSAKVSGSHYNPAATLASMLRRDTGRFSRPLGIAYILAQVVGGFLGGVVAWVLIPGRIPFGSGHDTVGQAVLSEFIGTFLLAFLYLTQTEETTKLSKDPAITTLIIAASYIASLLMVSAPNEYLASLNPAIAVGASFSQLYSSDARAISRIWLYGLIPFVGGLIAVIFFEIIYKKVAQTIKETEDDVDVGILDKESANE